VQKPLNNPRAGGGGRLMCRTLLLVGILRRLTLQTLHELNRMSNPIKQFRIVALAEGISFLVLLGIAMPLKYLADVPQPVKIVGAIHGGLFILYILAVFRAARYSKWSLERIFEAIVASVFPLGPFWFEHKLKREAAAAEAQQGVGDPKSAPNAGSVLRSD
jgi:integral membrane protein